MATAASGNPTVEYSDATGDVVVRPEGVPSSSAPNAVSAAVDIHQTELRASANDTVEILVSVADLSQVNTTGTEPTMEAYFSVLCTVGPRADFIVATALYRAAGGGYWTFSLLNNSSGKTVDVEGEARYPESQVNIRIHRAAANQVIGESAPWGSFETRAGAYMMEGGIFVGDWSEDSQDQFLALDVVQNQSSESPSPPRSGGSTPATSPVVAVSVILGVIVVAGYRRRGPESQ